MTRAENFGGGLVPIVFQEICDGCDQYSTSPATLASFLDFLQADSNVVVKTMHDALSEGARAAARHDRTCFDDRVQRSGVLGGFLRRLGAGVAGRDRRQVGCRRRVLHDRRQRLRRTTSARSYTAPFSVSATTTVKYRAYDVAGNAETVKSQVIKADSVAPASTIACNAAACSSGFYTGSVQVALAATDAGSGVAAIHYTIDNSAPTLSSPTYTTPFTGRVDDHREVPCVRRRRQRGDAAVEARPHRHESHRRPASRATRRRARTGGTTARCRFRSPPATAAAPASRRFTTRPTARRRLRRARPTRRRSPSSSTTTVKFRAYDMVDNAEAPHVAGRRHRHGCADIGYLLQRQGVRGGLVPRVR